MTYSDYFKLTAVVHFEIALLTQFEQSQLKHHPLTFDLAPSRAERIIDL